MSKYGFMLSWPSHHLSSNARGHWSNRAGAAQSQRIEAWAETLRIKAKGTVISFTYHPPDKRQRDAQNMPHMVKSAIDGIADALRVDDSNFVCIFPGKFSHTIKGGGVYITISETQDD